MATEVATAVRPRPVWVPKRIPAYRRDFHVGDLVYWPECSLMGEARVVAVDEDDRPTVEIEGNLLACDYCEVAKRFPVRAHVPGTPRQRRKPTLTAQLAAANDQLAQLRALIARMVPMLARVDPPANATMTRSLNDGASGHCARCGIACWRYTPDGWCIPCTLAACHDVGALPG